MDTSHDTTIRAATRRRSRRASHRRHCRCGGPPHTADRGQRVAPGNLRSRLSRHDRRTARHILGLRDHVAALGGTVRLVIELPDLESRPARRPRRAESRHRGRRWARPVIV